MATVLAVDDDADCRELVLQTLELDHRVHLASRGDEALERATQLRPDLILLDLSLPVVDGWEVTRRLKADASLAAIPVIAITAHAMAGDREGALAAGCDDYLAKPVSPATLAAKVEEWLRRPNASS